MYLFPWLYMKGMASVSLVPQADATDSSLRCHLSGKTLLQHSNSLMCAASRMRRSTRVPIFCPTTTQAQSRLPSVARLDNAFFASSDDEKQFLRRRQMLGFIALYEVSLDFGLALGCKYNLDRALI